MQNRADEKREQARRVCFRRWEVENRLSSERLALAQSARIALYGPRGLMSNEEDQSAERANRAARRAATVGVWNQVTRSIDTVHADESVFVTSTEQRTLTSMNIKNPHKFLTWYQARQSARQSARSITERAVIVDYSSALIGNDYVTGHRLADADRIGKTDIFHLVPRDAVPTWEYRDVTPYKARTVRVFDHTEPITTGRLTRSELDQVENWSPAIRGYEPRLKGYTNRVLVPMSVYLRAAEDPQGYSPALVALLKGAREVFAEHGETHPACDEFSRRHMRYRVVADRAAFRGEVRWTAHSPVHYQVTTEAPIGADGQQEYRTKLVGTNKGWQGHRRVIFHVAKVAKVKAGDEQVKATGTRKGPKVESAFTMSERSLARAIKRNGVREFAELLESVIYQVPDHGGTVTLPNGVTVTRLGVASVIHESGRAYPIREWSRRAAIAWTPVSK